MKGIILITNFFEDVEAIATVDVLRRAKIESDYVSLNETLEAKTQSNLPIKCDILISEADLSKYDFLVIPGGKAVMTDLKNRTEVNSIITNFAMRGKLIASICAAPYLVGRLGYFEGGKYTCFPGCNEGIEKGKRVDKGVVVYKNFISAKSMAYSIDFALEIIEYLLGSNVRKQIDRSVHGEV